MSEIIIEYLYPEVSNLYGDPFNVKYLKECIKESGFEAKVVEDELNKEPFFAKETPNLIYIGPMTEHAQELVIDRLKPYNERLKELIDNNVTFFVTGNACEIFGSSIVNEDGSIIEALKLYDTTAKRKMMSRYNSLFLGEFEGIKIVGNKSQFSHSYRNNDSYPFIKAVRGDGYAPGDEFEGIKDNNFMATYLLGPLLLLNPELTINILKRLGIQNPKLKAEKEAFKAYEIRLKEFENPETTLV